MQGNEEGVSYVVRVYSCSKWVLACYKDLVNYEMRYLSEYGVLSFIVD